MKPILFNTDMVRAILEDRKTVTRRVVKPQPADTDDCQHEMQTYDQMLPQFYKGDYSCVCRKCGYGTQTNGESIFQPPYRPGDILYVRETWNRLLGEWIYKADQKPGFKNPGKWRPSIHMPREAARIFLRATGLKVQRVQDITDVEARKEGCKDCDDFHRVWNNCYSKPQPVKVEGVIDHYESYPWEDIQETRTYRGKPWYVIGNPWVWVIEFERCEKS